MMKTTAVLLSACVATSSPGVSAFAGLEPSSLLPSAQAAHEALHHHVGPFLDHATTTAAAVGAAGAVNNPLVAAASSLLDTYKSALTSDPLRTKMITGATLALCGDAIAQRRAEVEEGAEYDVRRAASFMMFDASYRALQHTLFPPIVKYCNGHFLLGLAAAIGGPLAGMVHDPSTADPTYFAAMEQTLASQLGIVPFMYYPVFFSLTGCVQGLTIEQSIDRAKQNFVPLMERNLLFWIPVQFVQFGFVEEGLQIPFLCVCGLAWTFILSVMAGNAHDKKYCITGSEPGCELPEDLFPQNCEEEGVNGEECDLEMIVEEGRKELDEFVQKALDGDEGGGGQAARGTVEEKEKATEELEVLAR